MAVCHVRASNKNGCKKRGAFCFGRGNGESPCQQICEKVFQPSDCLPIPVVRPFVKIEVRETSLARVAHVLVLELNTCASRKTPRVPFSLRSSLPRLPSPAFGKSQKTFLLFLVLTRVPHSCVHNDPRRAPRVRPFSSPRTFPVSCPPTPPPPQPPPRLVDATKTKTHAFRRERRKTHAFRRQRDCASAPLSSPRGRSPQTRREGSARREGCTTRTDPRSGRCTGTHSRWRVPTRVPDVSSRPRKKADHFHFFFVFFHPKFLRQKTVPDRWVWSGLSAASPRWEARPG